MRYNEIITKFDRKTIVAIVGAILIFSGVFLYYQIRIANSEKEAKIFLNLNVAKVERLVTQTHGILAEFSRSKILKTKNVGECGRIFDSHLKQYKEYAGFLFADTAGNVLCSSPRAPSAVNIADRAHFKKALEGKFASGEWQIGRLTGKTILPFGYPVIDLEGRLTGVVAAGLDLAWLSEWAEKLPLSKGSVFELLDSSGVVLARHPKDGWVGESVESAEIFKHILDAQVAGEREGAFTAAGLDGERRLYAFKTISNPTGPDSVLELYAVVGIK